MLPMNNNSHQKAHFSISEDKLLSQYAKEYAYRSNKNSEYGCAFIDFTVLNPVIASHLHHNEGNK